MEKKIDFVLRPILALILMAFILACGVKTPIVVPEYGFKGKITSFKAGWEGKGIKLSWTYKGTPADHFLIFRKDIAPDQKICLSCPLNLEMYTKFFPNKKEGSFHWKDMAITRSHRYLYQICAIVADGNKICSQVISISANQAQP